MIPKKKFRKGIFIVAYTLNNNRIPKYLILKRKLHWKGFEFPKGGKNLLETNRMTALREIKEETGLKVLKLKNHHLYGKYLYKKSFNDRAEFKGQSYVLFSAELKFGKPRLDKREHESAEWLYFVSAIKKLTHENQKECLRIVDKWIQKKRNKNKN
jgi:8-oxo-dGTP pyrophosphatase MutT (NUDIX family)